MKQAIVALLRATGLLGAAEALRFLLVWSRGRAANAAYLAAHPHFAPPPAWGMYEAYSYTSYAAYAASGADTAAFIAGLIRRYGPAESASAPAVAEWGCGLARILAPLRRQTKWALTGFDYNGASIAWCLRNVPGVAFHKNALAPPLPCADAAFDALYCISVFTHLPADLHVAWIGEIARVLKPGGLLIASFHADQVIDRLRPHEAARFHAGELVVRTHRRKGGRLFAAYQPRAFIEGQLLRGFEILEVIENPIPSMAQTVYVARLNRA